MVTPPNNNGMPSEFGNIIIDLHKIIEYESAENIKTDKDTIIYLNDMYQKVKEGDYKNEDDMNKFAIILGLCISNLSNVLNPQIIVLSGTESFKIRENKNFIKKLDETHKKYYFGTKSFLGHNIPKPSIEYSEIESYIKEKGAAIYTAVNTYGNDFYTFIGKEKNK